MEANNIQPSAHQANQPGSTQQQQPVFTIGVSQTNAALTKQKTKTAEEIGEKRRNETFNSDFGESTKRHREDFAIKLRKERR